MTEFKFSELVFYLCKRPRMYTPTGLFYEIVSLIEGLASSNIDPRRYWAAHSQMTAFRHWVCEKRRKDKSRFTWIEFREMFGSDEEAFKELPRLYAEYANDPDFPYDKKTEASV